ncbi:MAG: zinc-ribbon domain-containing protein [Phycisphaerae bacterium]
MADEPDEKDVDEGPSDEDLKELDSEKTDTRRCPKCGREVYEDADRCPKCGQWINREDSPAKRGIAGVLLAFIAICIVVALVLLFALPQKPAGPPPATAPSSTPALMTAPAAK